MQVQNKNINNIYHFLTCAGAAGKRSCKLGIRAVLLLSSQLIWTMLRSVQLLPNNPLTSIHSILGKMTYDPGDRC